MDYRAVLRKYIEYVAGVKGTAFIGEVKWRPGSDLFMDEEWTELNRLQIEPVPQAAGDGEGTDQGANA